MHSNARHFACCAIQFFETTAFYVYTVNLNVVMWQSLAEIARIFVAFH